MCLECHSLGAQQHHVSLPIIICLKSYSNLNHINFPVESDIDVDSYGITGFISYFTLPELE